MTDENLREGRFPARIVAKVVRRGETLELLTNDVSFKGAFLRTDTPPALRQLVKVQLLLPNGELASGHAMVVHVVPPNSDAIPGVGIQFWGPMDQGKSWEEFIYDLRVREKAGVPSARATDKVRRASERFKLAMDVEVDGARSTTRDVSETGMAIRTALSFQPGMRIGVKLHAAGQAQSIDVIVRRIIDEPSFKGLGVEFVDLAPEARRALFAMLKEDGPESDAIFVDPTDPGLH